MQDENLHILLQEDWEKKLPNAPTELLEIHYLSLQQALKKLIFRQAQKFLQQPEENEEDVLQKIILLPPQKKWEFKTTLQALPILLSYPTPRLIPAISHLWIELLHQWGCLLDEEAKPFSQVKILAKPDKLILIDKRDGEEIHYYAPKPIIRKIYKNSVTGKITKMVEGENKSQTQCLQEAIFQEKVNFIARQIHIIVETPTQKEEIRTTICHHLAAHVYYTKERDFLELIEIPSHFFCAIAPPGALKVASPMKWKKQATKIAQKFQLLKDSATMPQEAHNLRFELLEIWKKAQKPFGKMQILKEQYKQIYEQQNLFASPFTAKQAAEKNTLQTQIQALEEELAQFASWEWAWEFPLLTDTEGCFSRFAFIASSLPLPTEICDSILKKGGIYVQFFSMEWAHARLFLKARKWALSKEIHGGFIDSQKERLAMIVENIPPHTTKMPVYSLPSHTLILFEKSHVMQHPHLIFDWEIPQEEATFLRKMEHQARPLSAFAVITQGRSMLKRDLQAEGIPVVYSSQLRPFQILATSFFLSPNKVEKEVALESLIYVCLEEKRIVAAIPSRNYIPEHSLFIVQVLNPAVRMGILAILNAECMHQYFQLKGAQKKHPQRAYMSLLKQLPIRLPDTETLAQWAEKGMAIMEAKRETFSSENTHAEEDLLASWVATHYNI